MASVNKVIIIGNVGKDPEVRYNPSGGAWVTLSLATTRNWKNRESGERQEETEWHRVVFNDRLAEIVGEYVKKGRPLYVEGRLKTRKWQDKEGRDTYTTEIIAQEMQLLGGRDGAGGGDEGGGGGASYGRGAGGGEGGGGGYSRGGGDEGGARPAARPAAAQRPPAPRAPAAAPKAATGFDDMDDDIPF
ncbi:single-stranded DNA-binding protein [Pelomonas sp. Root1217]|uniref:single-stranded DNA-binding protein n=1 Tax=unclassified Roseateles TaxID=2626991 RepID=UPI0006FB80F9|nr:MULTISPECIES: single-stranded DNA-binding protein [unclassified Roseateles]KQV52912.1 single-stranded DNA-binding protein [Pelomonas sp. Root1217]KQV96248.1 single-stranded DNA-binding protein [Pelomonas sp. Root1237]